MDEAPNNRRAKRMDRIDAMPADIRACVHEFGLTIVDAFLQSGVTSSRKIRHLVLTVRGGSYQAGSDGKAIRLAEQSHDRAYRAGYRST